MYYWILHYLFTLWSVEATVAAWCVRQASPEGNSKQVIRARDERHEFIKDRAKFSRQVIRARDEETRIHQRQGEGWQAGNQST
jgi:hypothetical protein